LQWKEFARRLAVKQDLHAANSSCGHLDLRDRKRERERETKEREKEREREKDKEKERERKRKKERERESRNNPMAWGGFIKSKHRVKERFDTCLKKLPMK
jgi:hypothetical protein